jgi:hypothetical protein
MSAADQGPAGSSLTREQVLDELEFLAKVEAGLAPGDYLRATRRQAADSFEERLLAASDRGYRLIIDALKDQFATAGTFSSLAVSAMRVVDDANRLLAQRGLLPPFTSP